MSAVRSSTTRQLLFVAVFAAVGAGSLWYWGAPGAEQAQQAIENKRARAFEAQVASEMDALTGEAMAYIEAVEDCDCETILSKTDWIQQRLARQAQSGASDAELAQDRASLCEKVCARDDDGFRIQLEGVADAYLFFPGASYRFIGKDGGRDDLETPVATRAWVEVEFPSPKECLRDPEGNTISAITVGLNVSPEGRIVKAGVLGNAEIVWDSVRYRW